MVKHKEREHGFKCIIFKGQSIGTCSFEFDVRDAEDCGIHPGLLHKGIKKIDPEYLCVRVMFCYIESQPPKTTADIQYTSSLDLRQHGRPDSISRCQWPGFREAYAFESDGIDVGKRKNGVDL